MEQTKGAVEAPTRQSGSVFCWQPAQLTGRQTAGGYARIELTTGAPLAAAQPGQFVMLRQGTDPLLPRPFSVLGVEGRQLILLLRAEGRLRSRLAHLQLGEELEVRGPHGMPFAHRLAPDRRYLLVGGGCGIAPLAFFWRRHPERVAGAALGARGRGLAQLLPDVPLTVEEDGGQTAVAEAVRRWAPDSGVIVCGPPGMLAAAAAAFRGRPGVFLALEQRMGCGIGACQGCVVMTRSGPKRVCRDGPLFSLEELGWPT
ncbi:MAG: hypothetical protein ACP5G2_00440 [Candidatus Bipolaricaulaceae bacterium]